MTLASAQGEPTEPRARDAGIVIGVLPVGPLNAITDVEGVKVGHVTIDEGKDIHTGVTAIVPHGPWVYWSKAIMAAY